MIPHATSDAQQMTNKRIFYAAVLAVLLITTGFATGFVTGFLTGIDYRGKHEAHVSDAVVTKPVSSPIHVAANLPLTGPLATYGVAVKEGASMALDDNSKDKLKDTSNKLLESSLIAFPRYLTPCKTF